MMVDHASSTHFTRYASLTGRSVLVTGGASGIGEAIVRAFAHQGAAVGFIDRNLEAGNALCEELVAQGSAAVFCHCDVTQVVDFVSALTQIAQTLGDVDILINNVGDDRRHRLSAVSLSDWHQNMAVNLDPAFLACQTLYPAMAAKGGGCVINIGSINAFLAPRDLVCYNTAKAALLGLTKSLAREYGGSNVRVNAVLPGWISTARQRQQWLTPEEEQRWVQQLCLQRCILPEDVARLVLFLSSDDAACITGQFFQIDAGRC